MASKKSPKKPKSGLTVKAYRGDAKTLLAFNLPKEKTKNLAGFTVKVAPGNKAPFYLQNQLRFEDPTKHAQDAKLPANSSFNAPIINSAGCTSRAPCIRACSRRWGPMPTPQRRGTSMPVTD